MHINRATKYILAAVLVSAVMPAQSYAGTYYVSPSGSDTNPGTQTAPLRTFYRAAKMSRPGDTFIFENGIYNETQYPWIETTNGVATASTPIVFKSRNKHGAVLVFQNMPNEKILMRQHYVTIQDFEITQNVKHGGNDHMVYAYTGSSNIRIIGNRIHNQVKDCVKGHGTDNLVVDGNQCFDSTNEGIDVLDSYNVTVSNNELWDITGPAATAIMLKGGGRDFKVFNNTIRASAPLMYGIMLGGHSCTACTYDYSASGYEAYNSVAWNNVIVSNPAGNVTYALSLIGAADSAFVNNVVIGARVGVFVAKPNNVSVGWAWDPLVKNAVIQNNILQGCTQQGMLINSGSIQGTFTHDYNTYFNCANTPAQAHGSTADPMFVNPMSDWHLRSGSPSATTGVTIPAFTGYQGAAIAVSRDRAGVQRTTPWARGAYSNQIETTAPAAPTNVRIIG